MKGLIFPTMLLIVALAGGLVGRDVGHKEGFRSAVEALHGSNDEPAYDVVCYDSTGSNIVITRADKGTLRVGNGFIRFKNDGNRRIVSGACLIVEVGK